MSSFAERQSRAFFVPAAALAAALWGAGCSSSASSGPGLDAGVGTADVTTTADVTPPVEVGRPDGEGSVAPPPFTIDALVKARIGSQNGTGWTYTGRAEVDVDWQRGPFARVTLQVDLESACYPFEKWSADPPPPGQNWPADCDAFDRNFNVLLLDDGSSLGAQDAGAAPPFEVIHAITPFGGPEHLEADITALANALPGKHRLRVDLVSYSDAQGMVTGSNAGWTVSAHVDVVPGGAPRRVLAAIPLFAGQMTATSTPPVVAWVTPPGTAGARLEYRTSGHGGAPAGPRCIGPAEEFCDRRHQIFVDGNQVEDIEPYRQDCQTLCTPAHYGAPDAGLDYCQENPCGDPASVRAPRANWCPGSMTAPFVWEDIPAVAAPGQHTFSFAIPSIIEGGNWQVSAIVYAFAD